MESILLIFCIYLLVSCSSNSEDAVFVPIKEVAKEHFNIIANKNFKCFKNVYKGSDKEDLNLPTVFNQIHALLSLGDVFLPPDSLIWIDTVEVTFNNRNQKAIQCLIPVSPQKVNPIPEGYFLLYYNLNNELVGFNYNSLRIAQSLPPFPKADKLIFEDQSIASLGIMFEGGFKNPLHFKRTTYQPIEIKRSQKLQLFLQLLSQVQLIPVEGIFGHKRFLGNPVMNIVNISLKDGQNFSIFSIVESQPNYLEKADENNRLVVYHYDVLNSCYQYHIDKTENPELVALFEELSNDAITMTREDRYYIVNPLEQTGRQK